MIFPCLFRHRRLGHLLLAWILVSGSVQAQPVFDRDGRPLNPASNLSFDVTPVVVKVSSVEYHIPRNYLLHPRFDPATFKVTYPGFRPSSPETRKCLEREATSDEPGCEQLKFGILGPLKFTNVEMFENARRGLALAGPKRGPFGYDIYEVGPENARRELYRKQVDGSQIYFSCGIFENRGKRGGICDDAFSLSDGNSARFLFRLGMIEAIPDIEAGIRALMSKFHAGAAP